MVFVEEKQIKAKIIDDTKEDRLEPPKLLKTIKPDSKIFTTFLVFYEKRLKWHTDAWR